MKGLGKLALRVTIGGYFFGDGMQLTRWFGGHGPEGWGERGAPNRSSSRRRFSLARLPGTMSAEPP